MSAQGLGDTAGPSLWLYTLDMLVAAGLKCNFHLKQAFLTSNCTSEISSVGTTLPERGLMISTMIGAPHLALSASPERYLEPKQLVHLLCCACLQSSQSGQRQPMLLQNARCQHHTICHCVWWRAVCWTSGVQQCQGSRAAVNCHAVKGLTKATPYKVKHA